MLSEHDTRNLFSKSTICYTTRIIREMIPQMKNSHKFIGIPFIRKIIFRESNCIHDSFITYKLWPTSFNIGVFRSPIATLVKATSLAMELNSGLKNNYFDIANDDWKIKPSTTPAKD